MYPLFRASAGLPKRDFDTTLSRNDYLHGQQMARLHLHAFKTPPQNLSCVGHIISASVTIVHIPFLSNALSNKNRPNNSQKVAQPSRNAGGEAAAAALNGASGVRSSSSLLRSSGFFSGPSGISEGLSSLNSSGFFSGVGEDAGPVFDVSAEELRVGRGGLSRENGGGSAGVRAEACSLSPVPPDMLAKQAHQTANDIFKNNVMKAHFTVKEGLEQTAVDFLKKVGASSNNYSEGDKVLHDVNTAVLALRT